MTTLFNRLNIALGLALLAATLAGFAVIPEGNNLPAHWNIYGAVDRYGPRNHVLIVLPFFAAITAAVLGSVELGVRRSGSGNVSRQLALVLSVVLAVFAVAQASTVLMGIGHSIDVPRVVAFVQGLGLIVIGNILPKTGPRTHTGVGKPDEDRNQFRVRKAMGILFIVTGVALLVAATMAAPSIWLFALNIGGVVITVSVGAAYACLRSGLKRT
jgi:uncharacterized membrane protein